MSLLQIAELEGRLQRRDARIAELEMALAAQSATSENEPVAQGETLHVTELHGTHRPHRGDVVGAHQRSYTVPLPVAGDGETPAKEVARGLIREAAHGIAPPPTA